MKLNFGRTMLASQRQNLLRGSSSLPVRVSSGFSDASDSACGALGESEPELIFHQNWSESVRRSTWRELKAVCLSLLAFASPLSDCKVFWYSANQNFESILRDSSRKRDLQDLAVVFFQICSHHCISFEVKWIPRDLNAVQTVSASSLTSMVTASTILFFKG